MDLKIVWSEEATESLLEMLEYVDERFGFAAAQKLSRRAHEVADELAVFPRLYNALGSESVRKAIVHPNLALYYRLNESEGAIELLSFRQTNTDPVEAV